MIKSMTGFGRAVAETDGYVITVEIKSVNHRYFEFSSRIPRQYGFLDDKLKSYINSRVSRGKVECYVSIDALNTEAAQVVVNNTLASAYVSALKELSKNYDLKEDFGASTVARFQDVLVVKKADEDEEKIWSYVKSVTDTALDKFIAMRTVEGEKMKNDISSRADYILSCVEYIEKRSPETVKEYNDKLVERVHDLSKRLQFTPIRLPLQRRQFDFARILISSKHLLMLMSRSAEKWIFLFRKSTAKQIQSAQRQTM